MRERSKLAALGAVAVLTACSTSSLPSLLGGGGGGGAANRDGLGFFVTSRGLGNGGDLGGLVGADRHCQALAETVGAGGRTWRAYLSTSPAPREAAVHARDRIGKGPWRNARGEVIAANVDELHGNGNRLTKQTALNERGEIVQGRGDTPNRHDILTGSRPDGRAYPGDTDTTCGNWTKGGDGGSAVVGHHDRVGLRDDAPSKSWNSSHSTRGCSQDALKSSGGDGLLYCFAAD